MKASKTFRECPTILSNYNRITAKNNYDLTQRRPALYSWETGLNSWKI